MVDSRLQQRHVEKLRLKLTSRLGVRGQRWQCKRNFLPLTSGYVQQSKMKFSKLPWFPIDTLIRHFDNCGSTDTLNWESIAKSPSWPVVVACITSDKLDYDSSARCTWCNMLFLETAPNSLILLTATMYVDAWVCYRPETSTIHLRPCFLSILISKTIPGELPSTRSCICKPYRTEYCSETVRRISGLIVKWGTASDQDIRGTTRETSS